MPEHAHACVCVCVCVVCVYAHSMCQSVSVVCKEYNIMFINVTFEVLCIHSVDLVKHPVLTLVSEIQRDRNDHYY